RCLPVSPSLVSLDLSGNPNISTDGLEYLLEGFRERSSDMVSLNLTGCGVQGSLSSSALDVISSSFRELRLGSRGLAKIDQDLLQCWTGDPLVLCRQQKIFLKSR
ncbi:hypothetical protein GDO86_018372, partial [Hymenochirus boettgeri]